MFSIVKRLPFFLTLELADDFGGVLADHVKRCAEPPIDTMIQQSVGKEEEKAYGEERESKEGNDHPGLELRTKLLLLSFDVKLQQNSRQDQRENHKRDEDKS